MMHRIYDTQVGEMVSLNKKGHWPAEWNTKTSGRNVESKHKAGAVICVYTSVCSVVACNANAIFVSLGEVNLCRCLRCANCHVDSLAAQDSLEACHWRQRKQNAEDRSFGYHLCIDSSPCKPNSHLCLCTFLIIICRVKPCMYIQIYICTCMHICI
jgi:hypothetical protein